MAKIIIVDDEMSIRLTISAFLQNAGHDIDCIENAPEAETILGSKSYDVAILDIIIGQGSGIDLARKIKKKNRNTQILFTTERPDVQSAQEAIRLGAFDYIAKPVTKEQITTVTMRAVEEKFRRDDYDKLQSEKLQQQAKLEQTVLQRTAELEESQSRYRTLVENLNDVIFEIANNGLITYVSPPVTRILGYEPDEMTGKTIHPFIHPGDLPRISQALADILRGEIYPSEYRFKKKDGMFIWIRTSSRPIISPAGETIGIRGVLTDISEQVRVSQALEQSEQRFRTVFEEMPNAAAIFEAVADGQDFIFRDFNHQAEQIEETKKNDLLEKRVTEIFPGVVNFGLLPVIRRVWQTGTAEFVPEKIYRDQRGVESWRESWVYKLPAAGQIVVIYNDVTSRRKAENERKQLLATLERAQRIAHVGSWERDLRSNEASWSDELYRICGRDQHLGRPTEREWYDHIHPDDRETVKTVLRESIKSGYYECEYRLKSWNGGAYKTILARGGTDLDRNGKQIRHVGTILDVTKLRNTESELRKIETRYRAVFEQAGVGIGLWTPSGKIISMNRIAANHIGLKVEELIGKSAADVFGEEQAKTYLRRMKECLVTGTSYEYEDEVALAPGIKWFLSTYTVIREETSDGVLIVSRDITERKATSVLLAESLTNLHTLIENTDDGIWSVDKEYKLVTGNSIFQFLIKQTIGHPILPGESVLPAEFPAETIEIWRRRYDRALRGESFFEERQMQLADTSRTMIYRFKPMRSAEREIIGVSVVAHDITEEKEVSQKLNESRRQEVLGRLCSGISHEYNNVLMGIMGYAHQLRTQLKTGSETHGYAVEIENLSDRATRVSRQLLNFAKVKTGRFESLDLDGIVSETVATLGRFAGEHVEIAMRLDSNVRVFVNPLQITETIINLILNARDAMPDGGIVRVETSIAEIGGEDIDRLSLRADSRYTEVSVIDNGVGMSEEILDRAFEPFYSAKTKHNGLGLGLSAALGVANAHGGTIELKSEEYKGTVAKLFLPVVDAIQKQHEYGGLQ